MDWCFACIEAIKKPKTKEEKKVIVKEDFILTKSSFFDRFYSYVNNLNKK